MTLEQPVVTTNRSTVTSDAWRVKREKKKRLLPSDLLLCEIRFTIHASRH